MEFIKAQKTKYSIKNISFDELCNNHELLLKINYTGIYYVNNNQKEYVFICNNQFYKVPMQSNDKTKLVKLIEQLHNKKAELEKSNRENTSKHKITILNTHIDNIYGLREN